MPFDFNSIAAANLATTGFPGKEVTSPVERITSFTSATLNASRSTAITSITITGDNATPILLELLIPTWQTTTLSATSEIVFEMWDGTIGSGTRLAFDDKHAVTNVLFNGHVTLKRRIAAFSGSKTININAFNATVSNAVVVAYAATDNPMLLRATWAG